MLRCVWQKGPNGVYGGAYRFCSHRDMIDMVGFPDKIKSLPAYAGRFKATRLCAEACEVLFATYPAGTKIPLHDHDTDNWGVITRGEMKLTVDGLETAYGVGDWYYIAAGTPHSARCAVDTEEVEFWFATEE